VRVVQLTEGKKVLEKAYFPTRCFLQTQLTSNNFNVKLFVADTKGKHTDQVSTNNRLRCYLACVCVA
jgi:hypothetical protein